ncbi:solute carrier organic anion transporter family member 3A1-like [Ptychodera flava]|uniref:solute carrier organic anion transporter family member 3A1-like n=1 Tax=Ptychodera flava TaxID=63121 RepID=UPI00396A0531
MSFSSSDSSSYCIDEYYANHRSSPDISSLSSAGSLSDHVTGYHHHSGSSSRTGSRGSFDDREQGVDLTASSPPRSATPDLSLSDGIFNVPLLPLSDSAKRRSYPASSTPRSPERNRRSAGNIPSRYDDQPVSESEFRSPSRSRISRGSESRPSINGSQRSVQSAEAVRSGSRTPSRAGSTNVLQDIMEGTVSGTRAPRSPSEVDMENGNEGGGLSRLEPEGRHSSSHDSLTHQNGSVPSLTHAGVSGSRSSLSQEKKEDKLDAESKSNASRDNITSIGVTGEDGKQESDQGVQQAPKTNVVVHISEGSNDSDDLGRDHKCGICCCTCGCVQRLANSKYFLFMVCALLLLQTYLAGFMASMITTIERRFDLFTTEVGILASMYEVGSLVAVVVVSFWGGKSQSHRPKWIATGACFIVVGCAVTILPHFLSDSYSPRPSGSKGSDASLDIYKFNYRERLCNATAEEPEFDRCESDSPMLFGKKDMTFFYYLMLALGQLLVGMGSTPVITLGVAYIDDNISSRAAPLYISIFDSMFGLGPIIGFVAGWLLGQVYVDFYNTETDLSREDPRWVAAWWLGILIGGALVFVASIPFWCFPKKLWVEWQPVSSAVKDQQVETQQGELTKEQEAAGTEIVMRPRKLPRRVKDMPGTTKRLFSNCTYVCISIGACCELAFAAGYYLFLPKYLQSQYGISASFADLVMACVPAPSFVVGVIIIGVIIYRFKMSRRGMLILLVILAFFSTVLMGLQLLLGCDSPVFAGASVSYYKGYDLKETGLSAACNKDCGCTERAYNPVCGSNGVTYYSPCYAGCTSQVDGKFVECECVAASEANISMSSLLSTPSPNGRNDTKLQRDAADDNLAYDVAAGTTHEASKIYPDPATPGICQRDCIFFIPFMLMLCLSTMLLSMETIPVVMVTLRSVTQMDKAFAIGIQYLIIRLFGFVPAPIYYGKTIDLTCILRHTKACGEDGACWVYDIETYKYLYFGLSIGLKGIAFIFFVIALISLCTCRPKTEIVDLEAETTALTVGEVTSSSDSPKKSKKGKKEKKGKRESGGAFEEREDMEPGETSTLRAEDKEPRKPVQRDLEQAGSRDSRSEDGFVMADPENVKSEETKLAEVVTRHESNKSLDQDDDIEDIDAIVD